MDRLRKELLFNLIVFSFILSSIYGVFFTNVMYLDAKANYTESLWIGFFPVFIIMFLTFYLTNVVISFIHFGVFCFVDKKISSKIGLFDIIGVIIIGAICYLLNDLRLAVLFLSFIVFSIISLINNKVEKKGRITS